MGAASQAPKTRWVGTGVGKLDILRAIGGFGVVLGGIVVGGSRTTVVDVVDATVVDVVDATVVDVVDATVVDVLVVVEGTVVVVEEGSGVVVVVVVVGAGSVTAISMKESLRTVDAQGELFVRRGVFLCRRGRFDEEAASRVLSPNVVDVDEGAPMALPSWTSRPDIAKPVPPTRATTDALAVTIARRCR